MLNSGRIETIIIISCSLIGMWLVLAIKGKYNQEVAIKTIGNCFQ